MRCSEQATHCFLWGFAILGLGRGQRNTVEDSFTKRHTYRSGEALIEIRDSELYRTTHKTFEAYCQERWGMTRKYANYLVQSAGVVKQLAEKSDKHACQITNPRQAPELARVEPEQREAVLAILYAVARPHFIRATAPSPPKATSNKAAVGAELSGTVGVGGT